VGGLLIFHRTRTASRPAHDHTPELQTTMKRIDMAAGESSHAYQQSTKPVNATSQYDEFFEPSMSETQQVDVTYAFWNSLFARPAPQLRQRLVELDGTRADCDDAAERARLDAAINAIEFGLRTCADMPDWGATLA